jgi:hypothetical protein
MRILITLAFITGCYFEAEESELSTEQRSNKEKIDYDDWNDDGTGECGIEKCPGDKNEDEAELWTLDQIQGERYLCWDDFYQYVGDNYDSFCKCLIEKLSIRWSYDDYKRHEFSYIKRLNTTGALARCNEPMSEWKFDPEEDIEADREWEPSDDELEPELDDIMGEE